MNSAIEKYLEDTLEPKADWVKELEVYAKENHIPIMEPLGIDFLMQIIRMKKPSNILEIGTAIGYSALRMLEAYPQAKIVTVERDQVRYEQAVKNINSLNKQYNITVINGDALVNSDQLKNYGPFDLLFIDASKGYYQQFFDTFRTALSDSAIIVSDNVLFKGHVADDSEASDRFKKIAGKLRKYNEWLVNHPMYKTTIVPIGDGVAISIKR